MKQAPLKICITAANGKMGKAILKQLADRKSEFQLVGTLGRTVDDSASPCQYQQFNQLPQKPDVIIDFSRPEFALKIAAEAADAGVAFVSGTTGFSQQQFQQLRQFSEQIPVLWAANMSPGINLALELVKLTSRVLGAEAQIEISEAHHVHKVDAPSGTALAFGEQIAQVRGEPLQQLMSFDADTDAETRVQNHPQHKIGFNVIREGETIGEHAIQFSLAGEQLTIEHKATDRAVFATGAITAAKWLAGHAPGWYQMSEVLGIRQHLQE